MGKGLHPVILLSCSTLIGFSVFPVSKKTISNQEFIKMRVIGQSPNHSPVIKIILPVNNAVCAWNSLVPYSVDVSDPEDGDSKYQEIQSGEVMIKVKYIASTVQASAYLKQKKFNDSVGISGMLVSNCFSCHAVKTKLSGPSFLDISQRYAHTGFNREQMINHIKKGSTGIWGKETMPTHPELADSVARQMIGWIMKYSADPGLNYLTGLQGVLSLQKPTPSARHGFFVITAFYTDHGSADFPNKRLTGSDQVIIQMK